MIYQNSSNIPDFVANAAQAYDFKHKFAGNPPQLLGPEAIEVVIDVKLPNYP